MVEPELCCPRCGYLMLEGGRCPECGIETRTTQLTPRSTWEARKRWRKEVACVALILAVLQAQCLFMVDPQRSAWPVSFTDRLGNFALSLTGPFAFVIAWEVDAPGITFATLVLVIVVAFAALSYRDAKYPGARFFFYLILGFWMFLGLVLAIGPD